jgi:leader peptidase (prepilin peptidase)/N-methyltransferase
MPRRRLPDMLNHVIIAGMQSLLFALAGLLVGGLINALADSLPHRAGAKAPHCVHCGHRYGLIGWLALGRVVFLRRTYSPARHRPLMVELGTAMVFGCIPLALGISVDALFVALYAAILILIVVIDFEHRLVLHIVTLPATTLALLGSLLVGHTNLVSAFLGALFGFALFFLLFQLGRRLYGPGALGFGDVTLAMMMGAMLGFPLIMLTLATGMLIAGAWSLMLLATRLRSRRSSMAYGAMLALGGLIMIVWGPQIYGAYFT